MENNKLNTCCFIGHRTIEVTEDLVNRLEGIIERLITEEKVDTFLFGSKSEYDKLCLQIVTAFKTQYPHIKRIYVRAEFPYIDEHYTAYLLKKYDHTYYPEHMLIFVFVTMTRVIHCRNKNSLREVW